MILRILVVNVSAILYALIAFSSCNSVAKKVQKGCFTLSYTPNQKNLIVKLKFRGGLLKYLIQYHTGSRFFRLSSFFGKSLFFFRLFFGKFFFSKLFSLRLFLSDFCLCFESVQLLSLWFYSL